MYSGLSYEVPNHEGKGLHHGCERVNSAFRNWRSRYKTAYCRIFLEATGEILLPMNSVIYDGKVLTAKMTATFRTKRRDDERKVLRHGEWPNAGAKHPALEGCRTLDFARWGIDVPAVISTPALVGIDLTPPWSWSVSSSVNIPRPRGSYHQVPTTSTYHSSYLCCQVLPLHPC